MPPHSISINFSYVLSRLWVFIIILIIFAFIFYDFYRYFVNVSIRGKLQNRKYWFIYSACLYSHNGCTVSVRVISRKTKIGEPHTNSNLIYYVDCRVGKSRNSFRLPSSKMSFIGGYMVDTRRPYFGSIIVLSWGIKVTIFALQLLTARQLRKSMKLTVVFRLCTLERGILIIYIYYLRGKSDFLTNYTHTRGYSHTHTSISVWY